MKSKKGTFVFSQPKILKHETKKVPFVATNSAQKFLSATGGLWASLYTAPCTP